MIKRIPTINWLVPAGLIVVVGVVSLAPRVFARISVNTIDPIATISSDGHHIVLTGPVENGQVEWNDQRVTVTQRSTGAVAEGHVRFRGIVGEQQWEVVASVKGGNAFEPDAATAVAFCASTHRGQVTDAHQWLVAIELIEEDDSDDGAGAADE